jgi:hypothetical protein
MVFLIVTLLNPGEYDFYIISESFHVNIRSSGSVLLDDPNHMHISYVSIITMQRFDKIILK